MDDDQNLKHAYLSTRASEVRPAIAIPTWSSIRNIFCWYDASSPVERFTRYMSACWPVRAFATYLESKKDRVGFGAQTDCSRTLLYGLECILDLVQASLR
jgi:hypothetical protein